MFHPAGDILSIALSDGFQSWSFKSDNSLTMVDNIPIAYSWNNVQDVRILDSDTDNSKIICASIEQNFASIWGMDLSQLQSVQQAESDGIDTFDSLGENRVPDNTSLPNIEKETTAPAVIRSREDSNIGNSILPKIESGNSIAQQIRSQETPAKVPSRKFHQSNPPISSDEKLAGVPGDLADQLLERHASFTSSMEKRLVNIKLVKQSWDSVGVKGALDTMILLKDSAVWIDVLRLLNTNHKLISNLEMCEVLLPVLQELLFEAHQEYGFFSSKLLSRAAIW